MNATSHPRVTVLVATYNSELTIDSCLKALSELNYPQTSLEVIILDGCSTDATLEIVRKYPFKVISKPLSAPAAYNQAIGIVKNEVLGFVDSDAKVERDWLNKLVTHLDDPEVAGVSGGIETWNTENTWARSIGYELKSRYARLKKYVVRVATMNLLLKKSVIEEVGGFDESLPSQYDTDLGFRITSKGYKIIYESGAKCYHYNRSTLNGYFRQQLQYGKNTTKLYLKHGNLAKGDEITDLGMNIQPFLVLAVIAFFLLGLPEVLRQLWYVSASILIVMFIYYLLSAINLSIKFHDSYAIWMVVLYFIRALAWFIGAAITTSRFLAGERM